MDADNDTTTPGPPDWNRVRQEFPTTSRWVYMDIARKAILPKRIEVGARSGLAAMAEGDALRTHLAALRRLLKVPPINTVSIRRALADKVVERGRYAF